ncbi:hypothetical protein V0N18_004546 [Salmonella enterica]|nr:hypothetical protein [Salmonella enterica]
MSDDKTVPTEGVDRGHTMVVWPARPKWGQPGAGASIGINPDFDPVTGNGWLPEEDGYPMTCQPACRKMCRQR